MSDRPIFTSSASRRDPVPRLLSSAALLVSLVALVFSMSGLAPADGSKKPQAEWHAKPSKKAKPEKKAKPQKNAASKAEMAAIAKLREEVKGLKVSCPISNAVDLGTWCLEASPHQVPGSAEGQNNFAYAAQMCVREGGWLPTAAQLIGAAPQAALQSTINDDPGTSGVSEFPNAQEGIKDKREMSGDLTTTISGSSAAGSEGVTVGSKGVGSQGEPNPIPQPANPFPETLNYITVYDNHNLGGFAGGEPVGKAESFRCAYAKTFQPMGKKLTESTP